MPAPGSGRALPFTVGHAADVSADPQRTGYTLNYDFCCSDKKWS